MIMVVYGRSDGRLCLRSVEFFEPRPITVVAILMIGFALQTNAISCAAQSEVLRPKYNTSESRSATTALAFSADDARFASATRDGIKVWNTSSGELIAHVRDAKTPAGFLAFSPVDKNLLVAIVPCTDTQKDRVLGPQKCVAIIDIDRSISRNWTPDEVRQVSCFAFAPDAKSITYSHERGISTLELASLRVTSTLEFARMSEVLSLSPTGDRLVFADWRNIVGVVDVHDKRLMSQNVAHTRSITSIDFTTDGSVFATASWDHVVKVWNSETGAEIRALHEGNEALGCKDRALTVKISPRGSTLSSAHFDGTVKYWSLASGKVLRTQTLLSNAGVEKAQFSHSGAYLLTSGEIHASNEGADEGSRRSSRTCLWDLGKK